MSDFYAVDDFLVYAKGQKTYKTHLAIWRRVFALPAYHMVLVACALVLMAHIAYIPTWLLAMALVSIGAQLPSIKHKIAQKLPLKKLYSGLLVASFFLGVGVLFLGSGGGFNTDSSVAFLILCLVCKLWELNSQRDAYIVLNLCLFVLAAAFLWSQSLGISLLVLLGLVAVLLGFVALADTGNQTGQGRIKTLLVLLVPSMPLLVVLFLFFPRLAPLWSLPMSGKQATTGVSDSMSPGDFANLSKSTKLAFRVEFSDYIPARQQLYWRGLVFTEFDGITWRPDQDSLRPLYLKTKPELAQAFTQASQSYRVLLEPTYQKWLFSLDYSLPVPQKGVALFEDWTFKYYDAIGSQFAYQLNYYPDVVAKSPLGRYEYQQSIALPQSGNNQSRQLARRLYEQANGDPLQMVRLVQQYIQDNRFSYTLSPPTLQDNRIDAFLFGTRAGFCEHYASSFVFLMRAAGIPARVVAGYQGGELGRDGKSWEVRQMDAHAWAEVWVEGAWVRVDPTAFVSPDRILDGMNALTENSGASMFGQGAVGQLGYQQFRLLSAMYRLSDQMGYYWQKQVVGFDQDTQKNALLQWFNIQNIAQQIALMAAGFFGVIAFLVAIFWYKRRALYHVVDAPIAKLSQRLAKKDPSLAKNPSESYLGYLHRLDGQVGEGSALIALYRRLRFSQNGQNLQKSDIKTLQVLTVQFERAIYRALSG